MFSIVASSTPACTPQSTPVFFVPLFSIGMLSSHNIYEFSFTLRSILPNIEQLDELSPAQLLPSHDLITLDLIKKMFPKSFSNSQVNVSIRHENMWRCWYDEGDNKRFYAANKSSKYYAIRYLRCFRFFLAPIERWVTRGLFINLESFSTVSPFQHFFL